MANPTLTDHPARPYKLTFFRILRSEWIKLFSLRSTWWITGVTILVNIGICAGLAAMMKWVESQAQQIQNDPTFTNPGGVSVEIQPGDFGLLSEFVTQGCGFMGQLVFVILSILVITNEFSSGMIRSTFTTAPRRTAVLVAKMIVISILCAIVFAISLAGGWAISYAFVHNMVAFNLTLTSVVSMRILGGFILEMVLISLFCFGLGAIIRSSAGSIGAAVGIILVLPMILNVILGYISGPDPSGWRKLLIDSTAFLPTNAGTLITQETVDPSSVLTAWQGIAVLGCWAFVSLVLAVIITSRRNV